MEAIKKKIAALKMEMDAANEKVELNENKAKQENMRADKLNDDLRDLQKRLVQLERDYGITKTQLEQSTADLEQCEKSWSRVRRYDFFFSSLFPLIRFSSSRIHLSTRPCYINRPNKIERR